MKSATETNRHAETNRYIGYGLSIRSEFLLPGFVEGGGDGSPALDIARRHVPLEERWGELNDDGLHLAGVATGVMRFQVRDGCEMTIEPEPGADLDYVRAIISGELMSAVLRQRGLLALHGSCVSDERGAVGFVGHSGWGKSTLAMRFVQHGYRLLCDDVLAVDLSGEVPVVVPGYPQLKLREDSASLHVEGFDSLPPAHSQTDKRLYACAGEFQPAPVPLRKLYLLEGRGRPDHNVLAATNHEAFVELLRHTRATNLIKSPEFTQAHVHQLSSLLRTVPISLLHRSLSLERLPELYRLIENDLRETRPEDAVAT